MKIVMLLENYCSIILSTYIFCLYTRVTDARQILNDKYPLYLVKFRPAILLKFRHTGLFLPPISHSSHFPPSQMQFSHYVGRSRATSHFPPNVDFRFSIFADAHVLGFLFLLDDPLYHARRKSVANLSSSCTTWPHCEPVQ